MINNVGMICFEYPINPVRVAHRAYQHHHVELRMRNLELLLDIISIVLINIENYQSLRFVPCYLTTELGADGTTASGYKDCFAADVSDYGSYIYLDRFASQEIFYLNITKLADIHLAVHELVHARQSADFAACFARYRKDVLEFRSRRARNGDYYLIDIIELSTLDYLIAAAYDLDTLDIAAPFAPVVIDDALDDHGGKMAADDFLDYDIRGFPGAYYHDRSAV